MLSTNIGLKVMYDHHTDFIHIHHYMVVEGLTVARGTSQPPHEPARKASDHPLKVAAS